MYDKWMKGSIKDHFCQKHESAMDMEEDYHFITTAPVQLSVR